MHFTTQAAGLLSLTALTLFGCHHHDHHDDRPWEANAAESLQGTWLMRSALSGQYDVRIIIQGTDANFVAVDGTGRTGVLTQGPGGIAMIRLGEMSLRELQLDRVTGHAEIQHEDDFSCHDDHDHADEHAHGDEHDNNDDEHAHGDEHSHEGEHAHEHAHGGQDEHSHEHNHEGEHDHQHDEHGHDEHTEHTSASGTLHILLTGPNSGKAWIPTTGEVFGLIRPQPVAKELLGDWEECNPRSGTEVAKVTVTATTFTLATPNVDKPEKMELLGTVTERSQLKVVAKDRQGWLALNVQWVEPGQTFLAWPDGAPEVLFFYFRPGLRPAWSSCP